MTSDLDHYREMLAQPWGKIQYEITFAQLAHLKGLNILDFGAGCGLVSQFLSQMTIENYLAIRSFYSLQPNSFKTEDGWLEKMTQMELAVADLKPYKDMSFLQHVWLRKTY